MQLNDTSGQEISVPILELRFWGYYYSDSEVV